VRAYFQVLIKLCFPSGVVFASSIQNNLLISFP